MRAQCISEVTIRCLLTILSILSVLVQAMRQFQFRVGRENFCLIFVSLVPVLGSVGEQKTKPTQHGVKGASPPPHPHTLQRLILRKGTQDAAGGLSRQP